MKKMMIIVSGLLLMLSGCSSKNESAFDSAWADGIEALANEEYGKAEAFFETALKEKDDEKIKAYKDQTEKYQVLEAKMAEGDLETAAELASEINNTKNGSDLLVKKARTFEEEIATARENLNQYEAILVEADKLYNVDNFEACSKKLAEIENVDLSASYYSAVNKKRSDLLALNKEKLTEKQKTEEAAKAESEAAKSKSEVAPKEYWNTAKDEQLKSLMETWGVGMNQSYKKYWPGNEADHYGGNLPSGVLANDYGMTFAVDRQPKAIAWSTTGKGAAEYQLVACYSDVEMRGDTIHTYFFVIHNGAPKVLITMQNQGNEYNYLYFDETENADLKNGFAKIVEGDAQATTSTAEFPAEYIGHYYSNTDENNDVGLNLTRDSLIFLDTGDTYKLLKVEDDGYGNLQKAYFEKNLEVTLSRVPHVFQAKIVRLYDDADREYVLDF